MTKKTKRADTEAPKHVDTDVPKHVDAPVPEPTEEQKIGFGGPAFGDLVRQVKLNAPEPVEDAPWKLEASTEPEHQPPCEPLWVEPVGEPFKEITLGFGPPVPAPVDSEAAARAAALDAEYTTARREVAETGFRRTVHCRACGSVVSLGDACSVDALIAA